MTGLLGASTRIDGPILLDVVVLVLFGVVRSSGNNLLLGVWVVAVMLLAIRWPGSGLGLAAAIVVFPQSVRIGVQPSVAIILASAIGVALDLALRGAGPSDMRRQLAFVIVGVVTMAAATAVSLMRALVRLEPATAVEAARRWIEFGAGLLFLVLLIRVFAIGSRRPLVLGLVGITLGLVAATVDFLAPGLLKSLRGGWIVSGTESSRATGPFASPNRLGTVAAVMVVVGGCLALSRRPPRWPWLALAAIGAIALIISFSRGALLGLAFAGGALLALRSRRAAVAYAVVVVGVAAVAVPILLGARLAGSGGTLDALLANDEGRVDAWLAGIRMIVADPIFGRGYYSFAALGPLFGATDGLQTAHNEAIGLWAESGIFAFVGYLVTSVAVIVTAFERRADPWARAVIGAMVVFLVASSFNVQLMFLAVMCPVWLVVAYGIMRPATPLEPPAPEQPGTTAEATD